MAAKLTPAAQAAAHRYLAERARPLERARFRHRFGPGAPEEVRTALAVFQNGDGGFGNALEPDLRAACSSVVATTFGMSVLSEIGAGDDDPLVIGAVRYLVDAYDPADKVWPIIPPEVEEAPHAFWWTYEDSAETFGGFRVNPRALVLAQLYRHSALVDGELLAAAAADLLDHLAGAGDEMALNDVECLSALAGEQSAPARVREAVKAKLERVIAASLTSDPAEWDGYVLTPIVVAPAPDAPAAPFVPSALLAADLDRIIAGQEEDGSWAPSWNWSAVDVAAWERAEREWRGIITLHNLELLHAHGHIRD